MTSLHPKHIKRPLGCILVDAGLVAEEKITEALSEQHRTNKLLGEILVCRGDIGRRELDIALSLQNDLADAATATGLAAEIRRMLGELFVLGGRITPEQLEEALAQQKRTGEKIGQVLVRIGMATQPEVDAMINIQKNQAGGAGRETRLRLGELLITAGCISRAQLVAALDRQRETGGKIGEVLVKSGAVDPQLIDWGVRLQGMLMRAVLCAILSLAVPAAPEAVAETTLTSTIQISAVVLARADLNILEQQQEIVVTDADVRRGYVLAEAASVIEVNNNSPSGCLLSFAVQDLPFRVTSVSLMGREISLGPNGGLVTLPVTGKSTATLSYRFVLAPGTMPGTYAWPLTLTVSPL